MALCVLTGAFVFVHDGRRGFFADAAEFCHTVRRSALTEEEQIHAQNAELRQGNIIGLFEVSHHLYGRRRGDEPEIFCDKICIEVDASSNLGDQMRSVQTLEWFAAVRELALGDDHRQQFADAAVVEHEVVSCERQLRFQNQRGRICKRKTGTEIQQDIDSGAHAGRHVFLIADRSKEQTGLRIFGQVQRLVNADRKTAFHVRGAASGQPVAARQFLLQGLGTESALLYFIKQRLWLSCERLQIAVAVDLDSIVMSGQDQDLICGAAFECPHDGPPQKVSGICQTPAVRVCAEIGILCEICSDFLSGVFLLLRAGIALHCHEFFHDLSDCRFCLHVVPLSLYFFLL